jgi:hypothetical protein
MRAPPRASPRPVRWHGVPVHSPERSPGRLDASCGASKPAITRPQQGGSLAFNQVWREALAAIAVSRDLVKGESCGSLTTPSAHQTVRAAGWEVAPHYYYTTIQLYYYTTILPRSVRGARSRLETASNRCRDDVVATSMCARGGGGGGALSAVGRAHAQPRAAGALAGWRLREATRPSP